MSRAEAVSPSRRTAYWSPHRPRCGDDFCIWRRIILQSSSARKRRGGFFPLHPSNSARDSDWPFPLVYTAHGTDQSTRAIPSNPISL